MPELAGYLMEWVYQLHQSRSMGMAMNPISYMEIEAWSRLTRNRPQPWEVTALKAIDTAYLISINDDRKEATP